MPAGLKQSSATVSIGFSVAESAANTFTQQEVDLNLSPLDREVFVVQAINLDAEVPDLGAADSKVTATLTSTSQTALANLGDANTLAQGQFSIKADATRAVGFTQQSLETPPATMDYIGIIATNDFFVQVQGAGNTVAKGVSGKLYGYRAVATADIYAALVQSEVLSA